MNEHVHSALNGTMTHNNLTNAFGSEARSAARYRIFAKNARERGNAALAETLEKIASNETEHAELWLEYLGETGGDMQNLSSLIASEEYEKDVMYPEFADKAAEEGFSEIAEKFRSAANAENNHAKILAQHMDMMSQGDDYTADENTEWYCTNCGYGHTGGRAPARCPLCSYPGKYFAR